MEELARATSSPNWKSSVIAHVVNTCIITNDRIYLNRFTHVLHRHLSNIKQNMTQDWEGPGKNTVGFEGVNNKDIDPFVESGF